MVSKNCVNCVINVSEMFLTILYLYSSDSTSLPPPPLTLRILSGFCEHFATLISLAVHPADYNTLHAGGGGSAFRDPSPVHLFELVSLYI